MTDRYAGGVVIGRFMPPHAGHQYLIDFARAYTGDLTVFVCTLHDEPIPGTLRYHWVREMFPDVTVVHITQEIPEAGRNRAGAQKIWADAVRPHLSAQPRYVFASEEYGVGLADALGARFVPVDPHRKAFPVSAAMIRENPWKHWRHIPEPVRPYFVKRISVAASHPGVIESLASLFNTVSCGDYAAYSQRLGYAAPRIDSPQELLHAQEASQRALSRHADRVLFLESDLLLARISAGLPSHPVADDLLPHAVLAARPLDPEYRTALAAAGVPVVHVGAGSGAPGTVPATGPSGLQEAETATFAAEVEKLLASSAGSVP